MVSKEASDGCVVVADADKVIVDVDVDVDVGEGRRSPSSEGWEYRDESLIHVFCISSFAAWWASDRQRESSHVVQRPFLFV